MPKMSEVCDMFAFTHDSSTALSCLQASLHVIMVKYLNYEPSNGVA